MYKIHCFSYRLNRYIPILGIFPMSVANRFRSLGVCVITIPFNYTQN